MFLKICNLLKCFAFRLLHVRTAYCKFNDARNAFEYAMELVQKLRNKGEKAHTAVLYGEKCALLFALSEYEQVSNLDYINCYGIDRYDMMAMTGTV
jgi:hypothetical protein